MSEESSSNMFLLASTSKPGMNPIALHEEKTEIVMIMLL